MIPNPGFWGCGWNMRSLGFSLHSVGRSQELKSQDFELCVEKGEFGTSQCLVGSIHDPESQDLGFLIPGIPGSAGTPPIFSLSAFPPLSPNPSVQEGGAWLWGRFGEDLGILGALSPGVQRLHGREAAVLQALPGIRHPAPEPEAGIRQLHLPAPARQVAVLPVRAAAGRPQEGPGGVPGEGCDAPGVPPRP